MSLELLYTSAEAGLRQGARGFCTVLSTNGMPVNLATRLETLSGYRHVYSPQDPLADQNPICWSHVRLKLGGRNVSVLSRIAAYGVDYSGRTNKLAHHVAVEPHEQPPAGPAWLLSEGSVMRTTWDGRKATPPAGPAIPMANRPPSICKRWREITGDAGWGGVVADAWAGRSVKPQWVIYSLQQSHDLLALLNESIALLPEAERWNATFSTYYTNLPPEIDCRVRFVSEDTEEARLAAARGSVINLTRPGAVPRETPLVQLARTGPETASPPSSAAPAIESLGSVSTPLADPLDDEEYLLAPPQPPAPSAGSRKDGKPPAIGKGDSPPGLPKTARAGRRSLLLHSLVGTVLVLLLTTAGVGSSWLFLKSDKGRSAAENEQTRKVKADVDASRFQEKKLSDSRDRLFLQYQTLEKQLEQLELTPLGKLPAERANPVVMVPNVRAALEATEDALERVKDLDFSIGTPTKELQEIVDTFARADLPAVKKKLMGALAALGGSEDEQEVGIIATLNQHRNDLQRDVDALAEIQRTAGGNRTLIDQYLSKVNALEEQIKNSEMPPGKDLPDAGDLRVAAKQRQKEIEAGAGTPDLVASLKKQKKWAADRKNEAVALRDEVNDELNALTEQEKRRGDVIALLEDAREKEQLAKTLVLRIKVDRDGKKVRIFGSKDFPAKELRTADSYRWHGENSNKASLPFGQSQSESLPINVPDQQYMRAVAMIDGKGDDGKINFRYLITDAGDGPNPHAVMQASEFQASCWSLAKNIASFRAMQNHIEAWGDRSKMQNANGREPTEELKELFDNASNFQTFLAKRDWRDAGDTTIIDQAKELQLTFVDWQKEPQQGRGGDSETGNQDRRHGDPFKGFSPSINVRTEHLTQLILVCETVKNEMKLVQKKVSVDLGVIELIKPSAVGDLPGNGNVFLRLPIDFNLKVVLDEEDPK